MPRSEGAVSGNLPRSEGAFAFTQKSFSLIALFFCWLMSAIILSIAACTTVNCASFTCVARKANFEF